MSNFLEILAVPARDFPGFCCPGDFFILGILPSRGWSHPEEFAVPGFLQSWGFCHPGDFPCLPEVPHALLGLPMPSLACTNATFPIMGAITCIALALYLNLFFGQVFWATSKSKTVGFRALMLPLRYPCESKITLLSKFQSNRTSGSRDIAIFFKI